MLAVLLTSCPQLSQVLSYIRNQNITVEELVKESVAKLGENIQVRRFVRFVLGEGIEKQESNFADEVAAQTGQK
jgi:elongation factor Ts